MLNNLLERRHTKKELSEIFEETELKIIEINRKKKITKHTCHNSILCCRRTTIYSRLNGHTDTPTQLLIHGHAGMLLLLWCYYYMSTTIEMRAFYCYWYTAFLLLFMHGYAPRVRITLIDATTMFILLLMCGFSTNIYMWLCY